MMRDHLPATAVRPGNDVGVCGFRGGFTEATVMATTHITNHLGATYAVLLLALPTGEVVSQDGRACTLVGPERSVTAWCPECRRRVEVEETSAESSYRGDDEVGYWVERLACGHENSHETGRVGASPGGESLAEAIAGARTQERVQRAIDVEFD